MQFSMKTDTGMIRSVNEDACDTGALSDSYAWGVVCDGMGGALAGEVASAIAVETISSRIKKAYRRDMNETSARYLLMTAIIAAGIEVYDDSIAAVEHNGMGTTVVAYIALKNSLICASVGDSRGYFINKDKFVQVTHDHSLVQELIDSGKLTEEEALTFPYRNIITRVLGAGEEVEIDFFTIPFAKNDRFLLCTDGLTNMVSDNEIEDILRNYPLEDIPGILIDAANKNGGTDNITVAVIEK